MSVSVDGFITDREGAFAWTAPSEELFRLARGPRALRARPRRAPLKAARPFLPLDGAGFRDRPPGALRCMPAEECRNARRAARRAHALQQALSPPHEFVEGAACGARKTSSGSYRAFTLRRRSRLAPWYAGSHVSRSGSGKFAYAPPVPDGCASAHERASQSRASIVAVCAPSASITTSCLSRKRAVRCGKTVASGRTRLYAPPQGVKSSSRACPGTRAARMCSASAAVDRAGSGVRTNSDLANRWPGSGLAVDTAPCSAR